MMANPIALLGLIAVAIPIVIHLLARHHSRIERFPTLRFISISRLSPTSRRRISDLLLLLVRMGIVAVAALALTQPSLSSRPTDASRVVTRVVIVDTSASMSRLTPAGPAASVLARQVADRESAGVLATRVETDSPADALPGAVAWLAMRPGLREIVIVSDFQRSALDSTDLASIPAEMGLSLAAIPTTSTAVARATNGESIVTLAGQAEANGVDASWRASGRPRPTDTTGRVAIVYRQSPEASRLHREAVPVDSPWMARVITALQRDVAFASAAADARSGGGTGSDTVAVNKQGEPVLLAGRNGARLQFELLDDAASLMSAAFNAALVRALAPAASGIEADSAGWTAEDIARWDRPATPFTGNSRNESDGRWFWLACIALIGLEFFMRSRAPERFVAT
jgi:hypothetical protein